MPPLTRRFTARLAAAASLGLGVPAGHASFFDDFGSFTAPAGNFNGGQYESGLVVAFGGDQNGWAKAGGGVVHVVDRANVVGGSNPRDFAVMIWQDNVITQAAAVPGSNDSGTPYAVTFDAGPAVYQEPSQTTGADDGILIELLRADDSVFASYTHLPGEWAGAPALAGGSFQYIGDGSGEVRLRIGPSSPGSGRFGGTIDNISLVNQLGPTISTFTASPGVLADAGDAVTLSWAVENLPLDSLVLTPGNINALALTAPSGQGSYVLNPGPDGTTEYTLTATKGAQSTARKVTVTLPPPQIASFQVIPPAAAPGQPAQFTWQVERPVTTLVLTPGNVDLLALTNVSGSGNLTLTPGPNESTTYTLTATRGTSIAKADATRRVVTPGTIFSDDFGSFTAPAGNFNGGQYQSVLVVAFGGDLNDWDKAGGGVVHVVDRANVFGVDANPPDFAVMIWQDNVITQLAAVPGSNASGTPYAVTFDAGPAVYQAPSQTTGATEGILIEVLRADDSVLASHTHRPGAWAGFPTLVSGRFEYTGDGTGDVRLRIGPSAPGSGRFGGTIDNVAIVPNPTGPSITSFTASPEVLADAGAAVTFNWTVGGLPFDSLVLTPGNINALALTAPSGQGSYVLNPGPNGTTEYTLTATKGAESRQRKVTVTLPPPQITSFQVTPPETAPGQPVQFTWQVERPVTTLVLTPGNVDLLALTNASGSGNFTLTPGPTETTAYTLTATRGTASSSAHASRRIIDPNAIFSDDFGGFTDGNFNGGQFQSGLVVAFGGNLPDWDKAGGGVVHVVDRANVFGVDNNPPDFAVMIWQDNVITQSAAIPGSNGSGTLYAVTFEAGPAVYQAPSQTTGATDGILIEFLRADDSVLASHTHLPGEWAGYPTMVSGRFEYTGDGSGDVRLRIGPSSPGSGRFGGAIDNISIAPGSSIPLQITSITRDPTTLAATLSFTSVTGVNYEVWTSPDLKEWQQLEDEVEGTGPSTQFTDTFLAPTSPQLYYEVRRP
ncbi:MAG: hypothetical protein ACKV19_18170 [Verrucomicrobiales bacterium]